MLPTQIYGTVAFWGNHNLTQVQTNIIQQRHGTPTSRITQWLATAYDNHKNPGVSLINPCSMAPSQALCGVQTYVRQERYTTTKKLGR
ncbi:hypothetical protein K443DRAFT_396722 [Laccaria amethystina LaAM-08-1]|uniref:Uncharacterized protein n=1 Tax=Laccaria amethystina LaAM-08-1 TaxID=1095629 RepID=A0A0C9XBB8_9AGAR|nr:hypothetical protein K443DRAFT_396722 [Laccaria amethystina LaAM-08-1]